MIGGGPGYEPETLAELTELVRSADKILLRRNDSDLLSFRVPGPTGHYGRGDNHAVEMIDTLASRLRDLGFAHICSEAFREVVAHDVADQVVTVQADLPLGNLNSELEKHGQCIPVSPWQGHGLPWSLLSESVGSLISMNFPHGLEAQCGSWRDWILGMTVVLADGTVVRCGSKAVKNVAGYDVQKLFVGARDTLGILYEVTLRTFPVAALPPSRLERRLSEDEVGRRYGDRRDPCWWIQRVSARDWALAVQTCEDLVVADHASHTLYAIVPENEELPRYPGDWVLRSGCGEKNLQITDPTQIKFMKRAKEIFDPTHKLNPGEMGIF